MLVGVPNDQIYSRQSSYFFRRALCITARDDYARFGILAANSSDSGAGILIGTRRYRAGVQDYD